MKDFNMEKNYNPAEIEGKLYKECEENGYFTAHRDENKQPFTIVMPPPNITGQLHIGHALDTLPQDAIIRYRRMAGDSALWLPGTDHASIATEMKLVQALREEGLTKHDIGREEFLRRAWAWRDKYGRQIVEQQRRLGASCDWTRERFTMDEGCSKAVNEVFIRLYEKGLIYRGERIINWCPVCNTALSDDEVEYTEKPSHMWHIKYPAQDGGEGVVVATTRPETMLGDTGVAVNPGDERYTHLVGKNLILPLMDRVIPVVADDYVEMEFGTGAVKMTPAHDPNDFEVARRHGLQLLRVMNYDGTMNEHAGKYQGLTREECRERVVEDLKRLGLLVKIEDYTHNVGSCYRCNTIVEPISSLQWFVKMQPLAAPAIKAVRDGDIKFVPDRFKSIYFNWMENIRDWCISRQLWWGHRIPAYFCTSCDEIMVARQAPDACHKCGGELIQDPDVLDTWFSSALWPFSTLGWPDDTEDFRYFFPTNVLVAGYDIIFFWVARMIFSSLENTGLPPFKTVYLHGLVRDKDGHKMSKSKDNGIDPLEMVDKYGADALRFALTIGVSPGSDMRFSHEKVEAARNFANKIWNAARFVLSNTPKDIKIDINNLDIADKWILTRYQDTVRAITKYFDSYELGLAAQKIYDFIWTEFCDWYIELAKPRLLGDDASGAAAAQSVLLHVLRGSLKLIHPFMPFISDEIYRLIPGTTSSIMISDWPAATDELDYANEAADMDGIMEIIRSVRNIRAEMGVPPSKKANLSILPVGLGMDVLQSAEIYLLRLASASGIKWLDARDADMKNSVSAVSAYAEVYMPLGELIDIQKEIARLRKELETKQNDINRAQSKLSNDGFMAKAPQAVIEQEREKLHNAQNMAQSLESRIKELSAI